LAESREQWCAYGRLEVGIGASWGAINAGNTAPPERTNGRADGPKVRFALYSIPLCRETDAAAERDLAAMLERVDTEMV